MADLTITAASVKASDKATKMIKEAGATITAGQVVYLDADDKFKLAQATTNITSAVLGIAISGAASGQPVTVVTRDPEFTPGATLSLSAAGATGLYVLSAANAGGVAPQSDLVATNWLVFLGAAISTTKLNLQINNAHAQIVA
jgi:hypothetical protein